MIYVCGIPTCRRTEEVDDDTTEVPYCRGVHMKEHDPQAMVPGAAPAPAPVVVIFACDAGHQTIVAEGQEAKCAVCGLRPPAGQIQVGIDPAAGVAS